LNMPPSAIAVLIIASILIYGSLAYFIWIAMRRRKDS